MQRDTYGAIKKDDLMFNFSISDLLVDNVGTILNKGAITGLGGNLLINMLERLEQHYGLNFINIMQHYTS
jgi:hypothetical protein